MKRIPLLTPFVALVAAMFFVAPARAGDDAIAPFVNKQTDVVVHVDLSRMDMDALNTWYKKSIDNSPLAQTKKDKIKADADTQLGTAKDWVGKFTKAGGKDLYILVRFNGLQDGDMGMMVVPLADGAKADDLAKLINPAGNPPTADPNDPQSARATSMQPATAVIGKNLVFTRSAFIDKLKTAQGEARPDLVEALAVGGDAPAHIAAGPGLPTAAIMLSQGNAGLLSDPAFKNVLWTGLALNLPPQGAAHVTMQTKDADSAGSLVTAINQHITDMKADPKAQANLGENLDRVASALKPTTDGTKVSLQFAEETLDGVLPGLIAKMDQAESRHAAPTPDNGGGGAPPADNGNGM